MRFEWDEDKNQINIRKHGISFEQAKTIFDGFTVRSMDRRYDYGEVREISLGLLGKVVVIAVVHTDRIGVCRLISARAANKVERKLYDEEIRKTFDT
jgi:uncharacterized DUF497 family protein